MKKYKSISVWYNSAGLDECFYEAANKTFNQVFIEEASEGFEVLEGTSRSDFEVELKGKDWVMYEFDGIGVLCVESDKSSAVAHEEYEAAL